VVGEAAGTATTNVVDVLAMRLHDGSPSRVSAGLRGSQVVRCELAGLDSAAQHEQARKLAG
jgi:hypothetical protein